ncbi:MAG: hypothetical protein DRH06_09595 [Deltaproteobacteria bacterium]|nr:MAG: hypothetical protein DRH06_09595 [Deltaproteobacteria bacterium]
MRTEINLVTKGNTILAKAYAMMGSALAACILADNSPHLSEGQPIKLDKKLVLLYKIKYGDWEMYIGPRILKGASVVAYVESSRDTLSLREVENPVFADYSNLKVLEIPRQGLLRTCVYRDPEKGPVDWVINLETGLVERIINRWKNI